MAVSKTFDNPYEAQSNGLKLMGLSYILLRSTSESIYAKRVRAIVIWTSFLCAHRLCTTFLQGSSGFSAAKTKQGMLTPNLEFSSLWPMAHCPPPTGVVVGFYDAPTYPGRSTVEVEKIASFMRDNNV